MSRKVNYYILVYSDSNIKYGNYVKVIANGKIRDQTSNF